MVTMASQGGQLNDRVPLSLHAAFFGWFSLLFALACSGYVLDFCEGEISALLSRWLQHALYFGSSVIALGRYWSFSHRKPYENSLAALRGLTPDPMPKGESKSRRLKELGKGFRFFGLAAVSFFGLMACALPIERRIAALSLLDGIWFLLALDWLLALYSFGRNRSKEKVKEALDDLRSRQGGGTFSPLALEAKTPLWLKVLILGGVLMVSGVSYWRLTEEEGHVIQGQLKVCLKGVIERESFRGRMDHADGVCPQSILNRFDLGAEGMGPTRKVWAQEKVGIDPLKDGLAGNQIWVFSAQDGLSRQR
jgi:hypothetical protein